jgi:hypothetical protein
MRVDERMRDATITTKTMVIAQLKIRHRAAYDCSGVLLRCVQKIQLGAVMLGSQVGLSRLDHAPVVPGIHV